MDSNSKVRDFFGCRYEPLFNYFSEFSEVAFRVVADNYVTDGSGTGIVHCAPAFGEDDYRVCIENQVITKVGIQRHVDDQGSLVQQARFFGFCSFGSCISYSSMSYSLAGREPDRSS